MTAIGKYINRKISSDQKISADTGYGHSGSGNVSLRMSYKAVDSSWP